MRLKKINYSEYAGETQEWTLENFQLGMKNLAVGRNASGKSRSLSVINALARHLSGQQQPGLGGKYDVIFDADGEEIQYGLEMRASTVISEVLKVNGVELLTRSEGGVGKIWAEKVGEGTMIDFQAPTSDIAASSRRDALQHSFLERLYTWATAIRYYQFSTSMGKDTMMIVVPTGTNADDRDQNATTGVFRLAFKEYGEEFSAGVIADMEKVGYHLAEVGLRTPVSMVFSGLPGEPLGLFVREKDHGSIVDQYSMSNGMYRVLALLIHVNYLERKKSASCVLVDDIGEGIDFSRSCRLVHLLREKSDKFNIQLIMSTNDKFVMNEVPLDEWSIMQRDGNNVRVRNYENSKVVMDEFKFSGLGNFAFLELDVINEPVE